MDNTPVLLKRFSWHACAPETSFLTSFAKMTNNDLGRLCSRRKFHIAPAPELFFSWISVGSIFASLGFHECIRIAWFSWVSGSDSEALIFHNMARVPAPASLCFYTWTHYRPLPKTQIIAVFYTSEYKIKAKNRLKPLRFLRNKMFQ